jgi:pilus assembly protein Flp/PilA
MFGSQPYQRLLRDDRGATAIEYGLICALIVIAIITSLESVADENTGLWAHVRDNVESNM